MKTTICHLQIIPTANILCHEQYDPSRAMPLVKKLKEEKHLANPIIVAAFNKNQYLQLDGMNRLSSFKKMGLKTIVAQIIDYNDQESVELSSWVHLFRSEREVLLKNLSAIEGLVIRKGKFEYVGHRYIKEEGMGRLCTLVSKEGKVYLISTNGNLLEKTARLRKIVNLYKNSIIRDVLPINSNKGDIDILFQEHPETSMMVIFPTFTRHQIIEVVKKGGLFPAGVTRHIIKRRCLSVDIPMSFFSRKKSVTAQNKKLDEFLSQRQFRVYEESTIFFE